VYESQVKLKQGGKVSLETGHRLVQELFLISCQDERMINLSMVELGLSGNDVQKLELWFGGNNHAREEGELIIDTIKHVVASLASMTKLEIHEVYALHIRTV